MGGRFWSILLAVLFSTIALNSLLNSCRSSSSSTSMSAPDTLQIVVSIAPQQYFVERIGDRHVTVQVMVPPGAEPHTFEPKPEQLKALSQASVYLRIRMDFEAAWMDKWAALNPKMLIVDTTQGIQRIPLAAAFQNPNQSDTNLDPHIWLSPQLVKIQAKTIYDALVKLDAVHQSEYQANLQRFLTDLDALDAEIRQTLSGVKTRKFIVFHPSWGYFSRDYQLEQIPIEVGGQEPSAAELGRLIAIAKQQNIQVVFAEPQFSQRSAETIAKEIGGKVLLINDLSPDWMTNLQTVAHTFAQVMNQEAVILNRSDKS